VVRGWTSDQDRWNDHRAVHIYAGNWQSPYCRDDFGEGICFVMAGASKVQREEAVRLMCGGSERHPGAHSAHGFELATQTGLKDGLSRRSYTFAINVDTTGHQNGWKQPLPDSPPEVAGSGEGVLDDRNGAEMTAIIGALNCTPADPRRGPVCTAGLKYSTNPAEYAVTLLQINNEGNLFPVAEGVSLRDLEVTILR
jgi:hypothetical protein